MATERPLHRRSVRLRGFDYSQPGIYFVTICAFERECIFGKVEDERVRLSWLGELVRACWIEIPSHFPMAELDAFVVMPNHVHGIIILTVGARYIVPLRERTETEGFGSPVERSIPTIVRTFKAAVSRKSKPELGMDGAKIWQRGYYERVLRGGKEYTDASRYIRENPMRWEFDKDNPDNRGKVDA